MLEKSADDTEVVARMLNIPQSSGSCFDITLQADKNTLCWKNGMLERWKIVGFSGLHVASGSTEIRKWGALGVSHGAVGGSARVFLIVHPLENALGELPEVPQAGRDDREDDVPVDFLIGMHGGIAKSDRLNHPLG